MSIAERRRRLLGQVAMVGFVCFIIATLMVVIGDPFWNLYFIWSGWFIALPVAVVSRLAPRSPLTSRAPICPV